MDGETRSNKVAILDLHNASKPKFAVFMRSPCGQLAKFKYLHDTLDSAIESCRKFASTTASHGHVDFTYYAVEIKHRVGIEHGKPIDMPME